MAAKAPPSTTTQSLAMTGMKIKEIETQEWKVVLAKHKARAIQDNPSCYASKYPMAPTRKLTTPPSTRRETGSAFY